MSAVNNSFSSLFKVCVVQAARFSRSPDAILLIIKVCSSNSYLTLERIPKVIRLPFRASRPVHHVR